jgi:Zn-dependent protease
MLTVDQATGLLVFIGFIFSIVVHECAHAVVASWCGDETSRLLGRITLNPIPHVDPFMSVIVPLMMLVASGGQSVFGGAKPVPVDIYRLRHPRRDMMLVALAGPISNLLLAVCFTLLANPMFALKFADVELRLALVGVLFRLVHTNLVLACFNMIPIPPLDGSRVLAYFLPNDLVHMMARAERFGILLVAMLAMSGAIGPLLQPVAFGTNWLIQHFTYFVK